MKPAVSAALIAGGIAALGWFISYALAQRSARTSARREAALRHLERQLGELYGPLAFMVLEGARVFDDLVLDFGKDWVQGRRTLSEAELEKWLFWVDRDLFPRNERIAELLATKAHLIEGERVPESFLDFVDHYSSWKLDHLRWKDTGARERLYSRRKWPRHFDEEVLATFEVLKCRHALLLGRRSPREHARSPDSSRRADAGAPGRLDEWIREQQAAPAAGPAEVGAPGRDASTGPADPA